MTRLMTAFCVMFALSAAPMLAAAKGCDGETSSLICRVEALEQQGRDIDVKNEALNQRLDSVEGGNFTYDAVAQSICASFVSQSNTFVRAVWRPYGLPSTGSLLDSSTWTGADNDTRMNCTEVCNQAIYHREAGQERDSKGRFQCVGSIHVYAGRNGANSPADIYGPSAASDEDVLGFKVHVYTPEYCARRNMGPNVCCCSTP